MNEGAKGTLEKHYVSGSQMWDFFVTHFCLLIASNYDLFANYDQPRRDHRNHLLIVLRERERV